MDLMISEVQITFVVLMGLLSFILAFVLPHYAVTGKVFNRSRKYLLNGTNLVIVHFIIQYLLHKHVENVETIRTVVNLSFGLPISYMFAFSIIYLQRQGKVKKWERIFPLTLYIAALLMLIYCVYIGKPLYAMQKENIVVSCLYAVSLVFYSILEVRGLYLIAMRNRQGHDLELMAVNKWFRSSVLFIVVVSLGFPIMTFNPNLMYRSMYGLLAVASAFYYVFTFIGYGLYSNGYLLGQTTEKEEKERVERMVLNDVKLKQINTAVNAFIEGKSYLKSEITLKEASDVMHVSVNMLKIWLKSTPYGKFSNWINYLRIEYAKNMLFMNPNMSSEEVAQNCGFCDRQYFEKQFFKQEGITPSKWKKDKLSGDFTQTLKS